MTADGSVVRASADDDAELYWGLRGGGGNFGVVTSLEMALHPVGPTVLGGVVFYAGDDAADVVAGWRDHVARCARRAELAGQPHHRATGAVPACRVALQEGRRHRRLLGRRSGGGCGRGQAAAHARQGGGRPDRAAAVRRAATAARRPVDPGVGELLHLCLHRETSRRRRRHVRRLPSQVRRPPGAGRAPHAPPRRCHGSCPRRRHPLHRSHLAVHRQLHRSHSRRQRSPTPPRVGPGGTRSHGPLRRRAHLRELHRGSAATTTSGRRMPPDTYRRLQQLKNRYDPSNLFRFNQNVMPSATS